MGPCIFCTLYYRARLSFVLWEGFYICTLILPYLLLVGFQPRYLPNSWLRRSVRLGGLGVCESSPLYEKKKNHMRWGGGSECPLNKVATIWAGVRAQGFVTMRRWVLLLVGIQEHGCFQTPHNTSIASCFKYQGIRGRE